MSQFKENVYCIVREIPFAKVMTYGQIAALAGSPGGGRVVGQIAHYGPSNLPWHRVVNARGGMANGYVPGGPNCQSDTLAKEGIVVENNTLNLKEYIWWPKN
ncbi:MGMT family protein [Candidatus Saccharibacteria bacterium]|nr:MGMT family protein [Candidatus Saccharibacteria bacterium]